MKKAFGGEVENGKIKLDESKVFRNYLKQFEGEAIQVIVKRYRRIRSLSQNAYYWGVVIDILRKDFGYYQDEMHEALKWKFLKRKGELPTVKSTTKLTTKEFNEYIEEIQSWASSEYGIYIPDPNEVALDE